jgi:carboxyl-terminal processing protease
MSQDSKPSHRINIWLPFLLASALVVGVMIGLRVDNEVAPVMLEKRDDITAISGQSKIDELIKYIEAKYVDEVDRERLIDEAIRSVLNQLDPHSIYISAEEFEATNDPLEGSFEGIGVEFMIIEDTIVVLNAIPGGPSEAAGIRSGDRVIMVEDSIIAGSGLDYEGAKKLLKGEKGSDVTIGVKRAHEPGIQKFTVTRAEIPINSIDAAYMLDDETGYIRLARFSATAYEEFMQKLEHLVEKEGMTDLVLDLRQNPGGYLPQATKILNQVFPQRDELMVYTEGRRSSRKDYVSNGRAFFNIEDVAVLIDQGSASASEIVAGAIQDHDRGYIVGRRSFGKGMVQQQFMLRDGSALRLTISRYYTPSGRSIQKPYDDPEAYDNDFIDRYYSGELLSEDSYHPEDSSEYLTSNGRVVYGGGGIWPDVFVPLDTHLLSDNYIKLRQQVTPFIFRHFENQIQQAAEPPLSFNDFNASFELSAKDWDAFLAEVENKKIHLDKSKLSEIQPALKRLIKAEMARVLFDDAAYFQVWNEKDPDVLKAVEVLDDPSSLTVLNN